MAPVYHVQQTAINVHQPWYAMSATMDSTQIWQVIVLHARHNASTAPSTPPTTHPQAT